MKQDLKQDWEDLKDCVIIISVIATIFIGLGSIAFILAKVIEGII